MPPALKKGLQDCVREGWLHSDKNQNSGDEDIFFFASPLHQWFVERKLSRAKTAVHVDGELDDFVSQVIRQFDP